MRALLGSNVPATKDFAEVFRVADDWGCECIQTYLTPSRRWLVSPMTVAEVLAFGEAWSKSSVESVVAHVPFLVNLPSPREGVRERAASRLVVEARRAEKLGVPFLVLHPGSHLNSGKSLGIRRLVEGLNAVSDRIRSSPAQILLETMSGQGSSIGSRLEEIGRIIGALEEEGLFGVCLDTAHVFEAGYDIRGYEGYEALMDKFDSVIGLDKLRVIHLNDSKTGLGSKVDRHAVVGEGQIGLQFFHALLRDERLSEVPMILEIPDRDERSKDALRMLREMRDAEFVEERKKAQRQFSIDYLL